MGEPAQAGHTLDHKAASASICEVMAIWNDRAFKRWVDAMIVDHNETGFDDAYRSAWAAADADANNARRGKVRRDWDRKEADQIKRAWQAWNKED